MPSVQVVNTFWSDMAAATGTSFNCFAVTV
jgi:hypothetical protein